MERRGIGTRGRLLAAAAFGVALAVGWGAGFAVTYDGGDPRTTRSASPTGRAPAGSTPAPATATTSEVVGLDLTALAAECAVVPQGDVPGWRPSDPTSGVAPHPDTGDPARSLAVRLEGFTRVEGSPPFSLAAVIEQSGREVGSGSAAIDALGSAQLWARWDGSTLHRGVRTWDGTAWVMRQGSAASDLAVVFSSASARFFWTSLESGDGFEFVLASDGACEST